MDSKHFHSNLPASCAADQDPETLWSNSLEVTPWIQGHQEPLAALIDYELIVLGKESINSFHGTRAITRISRVAYDLSPRPGSAALQLCPSKVLIFRSYYVPGNVSGRGLN